MKSSTKLPTKIPCKQQNTGKQKPVVNKDSELLTKKKMMSPKLQKNFKLQQSSHLLKKTEVKPTLSHIISPRNGGMKQKNQFLQLTAKQPKNLGNQHGEKEKITSPITSPRAVKNRQIIYSNKGINQKKQQLSSSTKLLIAEKIQNNIIEQKQKILELEDKLHTANKTIQQMLLKQNQYKIKNQKIEKQCLNLNQKFKIENDKNKKNLKTRLSSFNEQGDQMKKMKECIENYEKIIKENEEQIIKISKEKEEKEKQLKQFKQNKQNLNSHTNTSITENNIQAQAKPSTISSQSQTQMNQNVNQNASSSLTRENHSQALQKLEKQFSKVLNSLQNRTKIMTKQFESKVYDQRRQICELQLIIDEMEEKLQKKVNQEKVSIEFDEALLLQIKQTQQCRSKLRKQEQQTIRLKQTNERQQLTIKKVQYELDYERIKKPLEQIKLEFKQQSFQELNDRILKLSEELKEKQEIIKDMKSLDYLKNIDFNINNIKKKVNYRK